MIYSCLWTIPTDKFAIQAGIANFEEFVCFARDVSFSSKLDFPQLDLKLEASPPKHTVGSQRGKVVSRESHHSWSRTIIGVRDSVLIGTRGAVGPFLDPFFRRIYSCPRSLVVSARGRTNIVGDGS